jgi:hypothetical protein
MPVGGGSSALLVLCAFVIRASSGVPWPGANSPRELQVQLTLEISSFTQRLNLWGTVKPHAKQIDAGDQFSDAASQSLARCQLPLETLIIVSFTVSPGRRHVSSRTSFVEKIHLKEDPRASVPRPLAAPPIRLNDSWFPTVV